MRRLYLLLLAITPIWLYAQEPQVWETGAFSCVAGMNGETQAGEGEETDGISWQAIAGQPFDVTVETDTWLSGNVEVATSKREAEEIQSIQLDKSALALEEGKGGTLTVTLDAGETANETLIWHSSDESVATVNEAGEVEALQSGTATLTVTSASGNFYAECEVTVKEPELEPTPEPDPEPDPEPMPEPDPTYYRVDLRPMEGATILPASNMVEEGGTLTFTIQIEEGYVADEMVVTVSQGIDRAVEVKPDEKGVYTLKNVDGLVTITVTGVKEATSTGVETIEGIQVYSREGVVYVYTPEEKQVIIVAMNGILKASEKQIGKRRYELPRGFYIVWVEGETFKVAN